MRHTTEKYDLDFPYLLISVHMCFPPDPSAFPSAPASSARSSPSVPSPTPMSPWTILPASGVAEVAASEEEARGLQGGSVRTGSQTSRGPSRSTQRTGSQG